METALLGSNTYLEARFKSYYVVWKRQKVKEYLKGMCGLNRTM